MAAPGTAERTCALEGCSVAFTPYRDSQIYCSRKHTVKANNARIAAANAAKRPERDCVREGCSNRFIPYKQGQLYCSADCQYASRNDRRLGERLRKLDALLLAKGIDISETEKANIKEVRFWEQGYKDADGQGQVQQLAGIAFAPSWDEGPEWPVIQPGPTVKVSPRPSKPSKPDKGWRTAVIFPDVQIGYFQDPDTAELIPTHDEAAIDVALQVARDVGPDVIVFNGDNADFPELSRYRLTPTFQRTTQATIDRCTVLGAEARAVVGEGEVVWLAGNHEERLPNYIIDNASAAFGLRRGMSPKDPPVLSMPHLCRFEETGVTFIPGYPANEHWLNDNLRVIHGDKVNSRGATGTRYLDDERVSVIYGHIHRRELVEKTRHTRQGPRTIVAVSFGCLCRIDGAVPSTKGGYDLHGRPMVRAEDWQQGLGIVHYHPDGRFTFESVAIWSGWARYRDREYVAR